MKNVFDYIKSLNKKEYIWEDDSVYSAYLANKNFSLFRDSIFFAHEMDMKLGNISAKQNYDFYYHALPKANRFSKWPKRDDKDDEILKGVSSYFDVNLNEAEEILKTLHPNRRQILIDKINNKGGIT